MWLLDKVAEIYHKCYTLRDEISEAYIEKQYFKLLQVSAIMLEFDKWRWIPSMLQLIFYYFVLVYHWITIGTPSFNLIGVSFVIFGQSIHFCLLIQLVLILVTILQFKREEILMFHKAIATNFFDYSEDFEGAGAQLEMKMHRERKVLVFIPALVGLSATGVLIFAPIIDRYGTFDFNQTSTLVNGNLPFPFAKYPYQTEEDVVYYFSVFLQMCVGFVLTSVIGTGGFTYIVMSQNLSMQLEMLLDSLENIETRTTRLLVKRFGDKFKLSTANQYSNEEFSQCYKTCLKKNFQHHQIILRNFKYWSSLFSAPVFLAYLTGTIVIALSLLSTGSWTELPGTTIASMVLCIAEVGYMFLFSFFSQRLTDLNEKLRFKIYCIKWYSCDEEVRRCLRIFQVMTLRPMTLVAGGIIPANMDTFAKVMNSSYSYYNLVNAFKIA